MSLVGNNFPFGGTYSTSTTGGGTNSLSALLQSFMPPSPSDIMKYVLITVACVTGGILVIAGVYLFTRRGKGARNA